MDKPLHLCHKCLSKNFYNIVNLQSPGICSLMVPQRTSTVLYLVSSIYILSHCPAVSGYNPKHFQHHNFCNLHYQKDMLHTTHKDPNVTQTTLVMTTVSLYWDILWSLLSIQVCKWTRLNL